MTTSCKAIVSRGTGTFILDTIEVDDPSADEVLVQVKAAGVCHTDWDSLSWGKQVVMGHEGAGVVVKVGSAVTGLVPGDSVILNWAIPCMSCFQCQLGNENICESNSPVVAGNKASGGHADLSKTRFRGQPIERSFSIGTMSELTLVREAACVKMVGKIPFSSAAIIGCGVMTGYGSVVNAAKVRAGSSVVVLGLGGVGLNVIQAARLADAGMVIAIDANKNRLEMASKFGASHVILSDRADRTMASARQVVRKLTSDRGADYAFECTAVPELAAMPLAFVRNAGTAVQVSGCEQEIKVDMNLFEWDKIYINPLYGKTRPQIDFPIIMDHYHKGHLKLDELITRTYTPEKLSDAFEDMHAGKNAKGVVLFG